MEFVTCIISEKDLNEVSKFFVSLQPLLIENLVLEGFQCQLGGFSFHSHLPESSYSASIPCTPSKPIFFYHLLSLFASPTPCLHFFILHVHSFPSFPMHLVTFTQPPPYFSHYSRRRCMSLFHIYNRPLHPTCPSPTSTRMATLFLQPTYLFSLKIH